MTCNPEEENSHCSATMLYCNAAPLWAFLLACPSFFFCGTRVPGSERTHLGRPRIIIWTGREYVGLPDPRYWPLLAIHRSRSQMRCWRMQRSKRFATGHRTRKSKRILLRSSSRCQYDMPLHNDLFVWIHSFLTLGFRDSQQLYDSTWLG